MVLVTGHGHIAMAVQAMREGAYDFIEKPFTSERLAAIVRHAVERRAAGAAGARAARRAGELARHPGGADRPLGADAAGAPHRDDAGRNIGRRADLRRDRHRQGARRALPARPQRAPAAALRAAQLRWRCPRRWPRASCSDTKPGRSPSANRVRVGKFEHRARRHPVPRRDREHAAGGAGQAAARAAGAKHRAHRLEQGHLRSTAVSSPPARTTSKSLSDEHKFRADLYYRIGVAIIELPPLRERREDIPLLFEHFTLMAAEPLRARGAAAEPCAQLADLMGYAWPGNVRELRNVADRLRAGSARRPPDAGCAARSTVAGLPHGLPQQVEQFERAVIIEELQTTQGRSAGNRRGARRCAGRRCMTSCASSASRQTSSRGSAAGPSAAPAAYSSARRSCRKAA